MLPWLFASVVLAQSTVVALGEGLVTVPATAESAPRTVSGGWVAVLADCLEERAPHAWTVVDRSRGGATSSTSPDPVARARELDPAVVVVGVGGEALAAPDADPRAFREEITTLVREIRRGRKPAGIVLVGMVPSWGNLEPPVSDARAALWNAALAGLAADMDGVRHADVLADWPREPAARAALSAAGGTLTDQGHARVAAAVCDAILAGWTGK